MLKKIVLDMKYGWDFLMKWIGFIEATRISTGKTWLLHNLAAGSFLATAQVLMAALLGKDPLPWGLDRIYAATLLGSAAASVVLQTVIYFRGHYFRQPKIVRF